MAKYYDYQYIVRVGNELKLGSTRGYNKEHVGNELKKEGITNCIIAATNYNYDVEKYLLGKYYKEHLVGKAFVTYGSYSSKLYVVSGKFTADKIFDLMCNKDSSFDYSGYFDGAYHNYHRHI